LNNIIKFGEHYICELWGCDPEILLDNKKIEQLFETTAIKSGLSVVGNGSFEFNPHGLSCYLLLEESHASVHTWPENGYCALDLFTCDLNLDIIPFFERLQTLFCAQSIHIQMIERGVPQK